MKGPGAIAALERHGLTDPGQAAAFLARHPDWEFLATLADDPEDQQGVIDALAERLGLPALPLGGDLLVRHDLLPRLPRAFAEANGILPLMAPDLEIREVLLAVADALAMEATADAARLLRLPVRPHLCEPERLRAALADAYDRLDEATPVEESLADLDAADLRDRANQAPVVRLVARILREAVTLRASDIHLEPSEDALVVRYRVDGELRIAARHPVRLAAPVVSRVKIMADLDIAERRLPLDGRIRLRQDGRDVDLRVATSPTAHGESVVMRLLDRGSIAVPIDRLGFSAPILAGMQDLLRRPNGIVLVTGPTGSGKTTTLYAGLNDINTPDLKIITVEDPVEYQLAGITQIPVNAKIDLTFARVLRSVLRQDPDVVMIGEIRDAETARIAIQAALTGHLVLATLHTNDAPSAITRLVDMGVERFLVASSVIGVLAQRLCRRLHTCAEPDPDGGRRAVGCLACDHGYQGRLGIHELLVVDEDLRQLINRDASTVSLRAAVRARGMRTLYDDGMAKVAAGDTTRAEVLSATTDA